MHCAGNNELVLKHKLQYLQREYRHLQSPELFPLSEKEKKSLQTKLQRKAAQIRTIEQQLHRNLVEFLAVETTIPEESIAASLWFFPVFRQYLQMLGAVLANIGSIPDNQGTRILKTFPPEQLYTMKTGLLNRFGCAV